MKKKAFIAWATKVGLAMAAAVVLCGEPQMVLASEAGQAVVAENISTWTEMNEVSLTIEEDEEDILTGETKIYKPYEGALYTISYEVNESGTITITDYESADGSGTTLLGKLVIPSEIDGKAVTCIGDRAFDNGRFEGSLVIPDTVTTIGDRAFYYCNLLKGDLVIPDSVTTIGGSAFKNSGFDGELTISKNVTEIEIMTFAHTNFKGDIVIPEGVTTIGTYAFGSSTFDGRVRIPDTVTTIEENAFIECKNLTGKLIIPSSVTSIGRAAFLGCSSLEREIYIGNGDAEVEDSILPLHLNYDVSRRDHTIHAPAGSKVEAYAEKYEFTFQEWNGVLVNGEVFEFTDVDINSWMFEGINFVYQNNIMTGKAADTFEPAANMTRAEFATSLYGMAGRPTVEYNLTFKDVKESDWYGMPVAWAYQHGIISGYDANTFGVSDNITREQIALMLYKYATEVAGCEDNGRADALEQFTDCGAESSWAQKALQWAVTNGVMSGKNDPASPGVLKLDPTGKATRAECATMIKSYKLKVESGIATKMTNNHRHLNCTVPGYIEYYLREDSPLQEGWAIDSMDAAYWVDPEYEVSTYLTVGYDGSNISDASNAAWFANAYNVKENYKVEQVEHEVFNYRLVGETEGYYFEMYSACAIDNPVCEDPAYIDVYIYIDKTVYGDIQEELLADYKGVIESFEITTFYNWEQYDQEYERIN